MKSEDSSTATPSPSPPAKPAIASLSERLTDSEIEQLRQDKKDAVAYARKAFASMKQA